MMLEVLFEVDLPELSVSVSQSRKILLFIHCS